MKTFRVTLLVRCDTCGMETVIERKTSVECQAEASACGWTRRQRLRDPDQDECKFCSRKRDDEAEAERSRRAGLPPWELK
jgi:hypothetical protein